VWNIEQTRKKKKKEEMMKKVNQENEMRDFILNFFLRSKAIITLKINDFQSCLAIEVMSITWKELLFLDY